MRVSHLISASMAGAKGCVEPASCTGRQGRRPAFGAVDAWEPEGRVSAAKASPGAVSALQFCKSSSVASQLRCEPPRSAVQTAVGVARRVRSARRIGQLRKRIGCGAPAGFSVSGSAC